MNEKKEEEHIHFKFIDKQKRTSIYLMIDA